MRNRLILLATLVAAVIVAGGLLLINRTPTGKVKATIIVVPSYAEISINDSRVRLRGDSTFINPGTYRVRAVAEGFETKEAELNAAIDSPATTVLIMQPLSSEAQAWAGKNEADYSRAEAIAGQLSQESGDRFRATNQILEKLPFDAGYYRIDYGRDPQNADGVIVEIRAQSALGRSVALQKIRDWGIEPSDYKLRFVNLQSAFVGGPQ